MIATWVTQVSFFPQLVAISVENGSQMIDCIKRSGFFSLNILPSDGKDLAATFLRPKESTPERVNGRPFEVARNGSPFLLEASACLECRVSYHSECGDHTLVVGEVVDARTRKGGEVLTMQLTGWNYQR
jgi:flavin reductase (DIM6/NTAB) family NADH-FMN oxidoreductase RutF